MLTQATRRIVADFSDHQRVRELGGAVDADLWEVLEAQGLTRVSVPEELGGSGGSFQDAATILGVVAEAAVSVPLAEGLVAGWLLSAARRPLPGGMLTVAVLDEDRDDLVLEESDSGWAAHGSIHGVAWGRVADRVLLVSTRPQDGEVVLVDAPRSSWTVVEEANLAGEPRDTLTLDGAAPAEVAALPQDVDPAAVTRRLALLRAVMTTAAARRALSLTVRYANEREQFGRTIGKFQAVQQHVARLAGEADLAEQMVAIAVQDEAVTPHLVAAAKVASGSAADVAFEVAHQVHGAVGFTQEHALGLCTMRLLAWRDEHGSDDSWARWLGEAAIKAGGEEVWPLLTSAPGTAGPGS